MNKAYPIQKSTLTNNISIKKKKLLVIIKLKRTQLQCTWYLWLTWQWHTVLSYFTQHSIFIYNLVPYTYLRVVCLSSCWVEISAKRAHWASNTTCKNKKGEKKRIKKTLLCVSLVMQWLTSSPNNITKCMSLFLTIDSCAKHWSRMVMLVWCYKANSRLCSLIRIVLNVRKESFTQTNFILPLLQFTLSW